MKAMSTFLNCTGAGDYILPDLIGKNALESKHRNSPSITFKSNTKMPWFPNHYVDFVGKSSPPSTHYSPKADRPYPSKRYTVGKNDRFQSSPHQREKQIIPLQSRTIDEGFDHITSPKNYTYAKSNFGFGGKSDFTDGKNKKHIPGPIYDLEVMSLANQSKKNSQPSEFGFYNPFSKYEKIMYPGQEQHYYGR